jgi:hypothetical protein
MSCPRGDAMLRVTKAIFVRFDSGATVFFDDCYAIGADEERGMLVILRHEKPPMMYQWEHFASIHSESCELLAWNDSGYIITGFPFRIIPRLCIPRSRGFDLVPVRDYRDYTGGWMRWDWTRWNWKPFATELSTR